MEFALTLTQNIKMPWASRKCFVFNNPLKKGASCIDRLKHGTHAFLITFVVRNNSFWEDIQNSRTEVCNTM